MARVKFGALVTVGVGSLGGHVFQRNRHGVSVRTGYSSRGYSFSDNSHVQRLFSIARERWNDADLETREQWGALGQKYPVPDWDGDNNYLTGKQFHDKATIKAVQSGQTAILDPFNYNNAVPFFENPSSFWATSSNNFLITFDPFPAFQTFDVSVSQSSGPSSNPSQLVYDFLANYTGNNTNVPAIGVLLSERYALPPLPNHIYLKLVSVSSSGVSSPPQFIELGVLS